MPLSADDLTTLDTLLGCADADAGVFPRLRQQLPAMSLTRCDASDIDQEQPFRVYPQFNVYLVDSSDHCWTITGNPAQATGLVVADRKAARR
ncbi:hypothetical protein LPW26_09045 [Rhodopseudomonas sp. HC1]|uniref:hypothetical protein n=1 Tax=Rhodopseudomonas infernalis TaxID=2897386 RepID=UPI001EE92C34|nr:hypothetical protein [Rhodopseudomonas infernalis]MCG6204781.1 hypothetical protein [Rhodopseudomonas infernalis]